MAVGSGRRSRPTMEKNHEEIKEEGSRCHCACARRRFWCIAAERTNTDATQDHSLAVAATNRNARGWEANGLHCFFCISSLTRHPNPQIKDGRARKALSNPLQAIWNGLKEAGVPIGIDHRFAWGLPASEVRFPCRGQKASTPMPAVPTVMKERAASSRISSARRSQR